MSCLCCRWKVIAGSLVVILAVLAGSSVSRAEWPRLFRGSSEKPRAIAASSSSTHSSQRHSENRSLVTTASAVAQKTTVPYEEDLALPASSLAEAKTAEEIADLKLDVLIALGLERNPRLAKVSYAVESARGKAIQAGLYPNPTVGLMWDELFDKTGRSGINSLPNINQEIVTARKLRISQAAGMREVDQASWTVMAERYSLLAEIRAAYFDALTLQRRIDILDEMVTLAEKSVDQTNKLIEAQQVARLDLVQLEVEAERLRAELESSQRELPSVYKRLAAIVGVHQMTIHKVDGDLSAPLPDYDLDRTRSYVLAVHPQLQIAQWGVQRSRLLLKRAQVEPIPNLGIDTGYVRQNQNRSDDFRIGVSASIPLWNRNQGNIRSAEADLCHAMQEIGRVENDLADRTSTVMRDYSSARRRAERYQTAILPRAKESYKLSVQAYQGGHFEYLRVLEAQRAMAQASLEHIRALGDAWKAAAAISGLTIEDVWPPAPVQPADVPPAPAASAKPSSDGR